MNKMRLYGFLLILTFYVPLAFFQASSAHARAPKGDPIVIQAIDLDYADAEQLVSVLSPLLSPDGRIVAYRPTNTLIIKDRVSVIKKLVEIIKGPIHQQP